MSEDNPPSTNGSSQKTWLERLTQMFQGEPQNRKELVEVILDAGDRELIDPYTKDMIQGVLDVSEKRVRDIMIPRSQMVVLEKELTIGKALPIIIDSAHSRFPVINEDKDNVEGMLLAKDLLKYSLGDQQLPLDKMIRPCVIVPESKKVDILLREFRSERYHMAVVVDEYGGVSGLVTIEDILEQIVGEIEDEYDAEEQNQEDIRRINKQVYGIQALTTIEEFNKYFQTNFSDTEVDTVGGMVTQAFGHVPSRGEEIELNGYVFKIVSADTRRLIQLQVKLPQPVVESKAG